MQRLSNNRYLSKTELEQGGVFISTEILLSLPEGFAVFVHANGGPEVSLFALDDGVQVVGNCTRASARNSNLKEITQNEMSTFSKICIIRNCITRRELFEKIRKIRKIHIYNNL